MNTLGRLRIEKVDHKAPDTRRRLLEFLLPREQEHLFVVANLTNDFPNWQVFVAGDGAEVFGVAAFYPDFKSVIPASTDPAVIRALVQHVVAEHPEVDRLNGIGYSAWPALEALRELGYRLANDPRQVFMELPLPRGTALPELPQERKARAMVADDGRDVAQLVRCLTRPGDDSPVTDEEVRLVELNACRFVLEEDGRIVATAASNGVGVRAFQVLSVATDPNYRRRGFARAVCTALIRSMQDRGGEHVVLFTADGNLAAQACYQGIGFRATGDFCIARLKPPTVSLGDPDLSGD